MSEYDWDFRAILGLDDEERHAAMGEHVMKMVDAGNEGREDPAGSILDAVGQAKVAKGNLEGKQE